MQALGSRKGLRSTRFGRGRGLKLLEPMELEVENWVETVNRYRSIYHQVAGEVENLKRKALELGRRWVSGQGKSHRVLSRNPKGRGKGETEAALA